MDKNNMTTEIQKKLVKEFGFEDLSEERQGKMVDMMTDSVIKQVLLDSYAELDKNGRKDMEKMMENIENMEPNSMEVFLKKELPDYDGLVEQSVEDLKKDIKNMKV